jgi:hypothetical protein
LIERNVNAVVAGTMEEATALFSKRFSEITLDQITPESGVQIGSHGDNA